MRIRIDPTANYKAVFLDSGKTLRFKLNPTKPFGVPNTPEIEDVAINSKCLANCFIAGQLVMTPSGEKPIETIKIGDKVVSFNQNHQTFETKTVYNLFKNPYKGDIIEIEMLNGKIIKCTPNHKFLTARGWVRAIDLDLNDELIDCDT